MANAGRIYKDDIGTIILINMNTDISTATGISLSIRKPDGSTDTWTPTISNTYYLRYTIQSGDLDQAGKYSVQPNLTLGTWTGKGQSISFTVHKQV